MLSRRCQLWPGAWKAIGVLEAPTPTAEGGEARRPALGRPAPSSDQGVALPSGGGSRALTSRGTNLMGAEVSLLVPRAAQQDGPGGGSAPCQVERPACGAVCLMGTWGPGRGGTHKAHEPEKPH